MLALQWWSFLPSGGSKDSRGRSSYAGDLLNMASFRESSELEFGADDAFIIFALTKKARALCSSTSKAAMASAGTLFAF